MFLDTNGHGPGEPERDGRPHRRLTKRDEKTLFWLAGINIIILLVAPIGGATLFEAVFHLFR